MPRSLIPNTPIAVDYWTKKDSHKRILFLSHMHADHIQGLNSSWSDQVIYCSNITRTLLISHHNINPSLVVALPVGESVILPLDALDQEKLTVTLIDANHCPGAVMFLFQGYFGNILYTGDFRYHENMLDMYPFTNNFVINKLFLDNTYCDPRCEFLNKHEAKDKILKIIYEHSDRDVVIGLDFLGKEDLLCEIARELNVPIHVDHARYKTSQILGCSEYFTTERKDTFISVEKKKKVSLTTIKHKNKYFVPTIGILITGLYAGMKEELSKNGMIYVVPYSDHSSFSELKKFVSRIRPQCIVPCVNRIVESKSYEDHDRMDMSVFESYIDNETKKHVFEIPPTVQDFMLNGIDVQQFNIRKRKSSTSFFNGVVKKPCGINFPPLLENVNNSDEQISGKEKDIRIELREDTDSDKTALFDKCTSSKSDLKQRHESLCVPNQLISTPLKCIESVECGDNLGSDDVYVSTTLPTQSNDNNVATTLPGMAKLDEFTPFVNKVKDLDKSTRKISCGGGNCGTNQRCLPALKALKIEYFSDGEESSNENLQTSSSNTTANQPFEKNENGIQKTGDSILPQSNEIAHEKLRSTLSDNCSNINTTDRLSDVDSIKISCDIEMKNFQNVNSSVIDHAEISFLFHNSLGSPALENIRAANTSETLSHYIEQCNKMVDGKPLTKFCLVPFRLKVAANSKCYEECRERFPIQRLFLSKSTLDAQTQTETGVSSSVAIVAETCSDKNLGQQDNKTEGMINTCSHAEDLDALSEEFLGEMHLRNSKTNTDVGAKSSFPVNKATCSKELTGESSVPHTECTIDRSAEEYLLNEAFSQDLRELIKLAGLSNSKMYSGCESESDLVHYTKEERKNNSIDSSLSKCNVNQRNKSSTSAESSSVMQNELRLVQTEQNSLKTAHGDRLQTNKSVSMNKPFPEDLIHRLTERFRMTLRNASRSSTQKSQVRYKVTGNSQFSGKASISSGSSDKMLPAFSIENVFTKQKEGELRVVYHGDVSRAKSALAKWQSQR